jgi:uncharacterized protein with von Willebrand factor type A (vWA) domain
MTQVPPDLLHNIVVFGRFLRRTGIRVTSSQMIEVAVGLALVDIGSKEDVRNTMRAILVHRHDDIEVFDRAFDLFWAVHENPVPGQQLEEVLNDRASRRIAEALGRDRAESSPSDRAGTGMELTGRSSEEPAPGEQERTTIGIYSPDEAMRRRDFSLYSRQELADARRFLREMRWSITRRRSLRVRPSKRGRRLDVRRSLRHSMRHGGELLTLSVRGPKLKRRQLVLLCDISGSMDRYTRLLLHFLHSLESSRERVEVFVFSTRLTRITRALRRRDPDAAIAAVTSRVQDWSGGTRIGEALREFNRRWARRVLGHGAIVMLISDGWDRGDPRLLAHEMERLQRASYRLLWLNPLLGSANYEPLTQGLVAALPYVDDFLPVHNLASLEALAVLLNEIQEGRPDRRQLPRPGLPDRQRNQSGSKSVLPDEAQ